MRHFVTVAVIVVCASSCWSQGKPIDKDALPEKVRAMMPKDQLAFVERAEKWKGLARKIELETNGLRIAELKQQVIDDGNQIVADLSKHRESKGIKGWVFVVSGSNENYLTSSPMGAIRLHFSFRGLTNESKTVIRDLEKGDIVRFSAEPISRATTNPASPGSDIGHYILGNQIIKIERVK